VLAAESNYCPTGLARLCHVSLRTLQRRFAENYGMTISDWMRQIRLAKAYARVVAGESIKAVAYDLGFKQLSHFSRVFKEVHGVPPTLVSPRGRAKAAAMNTQPTLLPGRIAPVVSLQFPVIAHRVAPRFHSLSDATLQSGCPLHLPSVLIRVNEKDKS
jgi:AraC-like DNA-binding protein